MPFGFVGILTPFEREARLKELLGRQTELNAALDLNKGERQIAPAAVAEGSPEVDGNALPDERSFGLAAPAATRRGDLRRNRTGRSDDNSFDEGDKTVLAPRRPQAPETKFDILRLLPHGLALRTPPRDRARPVFTDSSGPRYRGGILLTDITKVRGSRQPPKVLQGRSVSAEPQPQPLVCGPAAQ
jgi:hypothetical protein